MPSGLHEELRTACRDATVLPDSKRLEIGSTTWLTGFPAPSTQGSIALRVGIGQTVIIDDSDVLDVEKDGARYLVQIRTGTGVLYRFEEMTEARPTTRRSCRTDSADSTQVSEISAREASGGSGSSGGQSHCRVEWIIVTYHDKEGNFHEIQVPYVVCSAAAG
jgi:hypothetical protein